MEKRRMVIVALVVTAILSTPMFGIALATPAANVDANAQTIRDVLTVSLMPPLENRNTWYGGAVIPLRVNVADLREEGVTNATVTVWVNGVPGTSPGHSFMGNTMVLTHDSVYQFNLDTKPYQAGPGSDPIAITIVATSPDDSTGELTVMVSLD